MISTIKADLDSYLSYPKLPDGNREIKLRHFFMAILDIDFRAVFMHRVSCFLVKKGFKKMGILVYLRLKSIHSIDISPYATIAQGLKLVHAFNIVIGSDVHIGKHCVLFNSVTLGNSHPGWKLNTSHKNSMPTIGSRVILCPGTRVIGKVNIMNNVLVGANSLVTKDIGNSEIWAGIPAKKISDNIY